jgi:hypothetical protein
MQCQKSISWISEKVFLVLVTAFSNALQLLEKAIFTTYREPTINGLVF